MAQDKAQDVTDLPGGKTTYLGNLPDMDAEGSFDWNGADFEQARNAVTGIAFQFNEHQTKAAAIAADPRWGDYRTDVRASRIRQAQAEAGVDSLKNIAACERVADGLETQAATLAAALDAPVAVDPAQSAINIKSFQDMSREGRVELIHRVTRLLVDDAADAKVKAAGREYLTSLLATNPFAGMLSERDRDFITEVMSRTKDARGYAKLRHLRAASRTIREVAGRAKRAIGG